MSNGRSFDITSNSEKPTIEHDPNASLDYTWNWTAWLADIADTIASVQFIAVSPMVVSSFVVESAQKVHAWLTTSGAGVNTTLAVTCRITTNSAPPRIEDRTFYFKIKEA